MPRRKAVKARVILPEPKFKSEILAKFINVVMHDGKKSVAEHIVYGALDEFQKLMKKSKKADEMGEEVMKSLSVVDLFEKVMDNVRPTVEVRSRRVGGATYQVPVEVRPKRSMALGMRWMVQAARNRGEKGMVLRLAAEMLEAFESRGSAVKKREETHRMAKANQAFAHFRWN
ncbi:MAG: small subunit ribosomal protein [Pseudomonadota bacterium]|nr:small subunit ribosomal protein [Pseudomonadota bacterium]